VGTRLDAGPGTSLDFYSSAATVIPSLLVAVAIQGRLLELSSKLTFRRRYRTVMLAVVVFGGEAGALMTIAGEKTRAIDRARRRLGAERHRLAPSGAHGPGLGRFAVTKRESSSPN
jgi:hypothetical protein